MNSDIASELKVGESLATRRLTGVWENMTLACAAVLLRRHDITHPEVSKSTTYGNAYTELYAVSMLVM